MKLELMIDGKKKSFGLPNFIPGRLIRAAVEFTKMDLNNVSGDDLDEMVDYVCAVYGKQFDRDEFYDGIDARNMMSAIGDTIQAIVNGTAMAAGGSSDPNK